MKAFLLILLTAAAMAGTEPPDVQQKAATVDPFTGRMIMSPRTKPDTPATRFPARSATPGTPGAPGSRNQGSGTQAVQGQPSADATNPFELQLELQRKGGKRRIVSSDESFLSGDRLWIRLYSQISGKISVEEQTAGYPSHQIFPDATVLEGADNVRAGQIILLPGPSRSFIFDERTGGICVVVTIRPYDIRSSFEGDSAAHGIVANAPVYAKGLILGPPASITESNPSCSAKLIQVR